MITANPILGTLLHAVGATSAAVCYTPQKQVKGWSWQTYWLTQASFCWFILPIIGAMLTIPQLMDVLREAPKDAMLNALASRTVVSAWGDFAYGFIVLALVPGFDPGRLAMFCALTVTGSLFFTATFAPLPALPPFPGPLPTWAPTSLWRRPSRTWTWWSQRSPCPQSQETQSS